MKLFPKGILKNPSLIYNCCNVKMSNRNRKREKSVTFFSTNNSWFNRFLYQKLDIFLAQSSIICLHFSRWNSITKGHFLLDQIATRGGEYEPTFSPLVFNSLFYSNSYAKLWILRSQTHNRRFEQKPENQTSTALARSDCQGKAGLTAR